MDLPTSPIRSQNLIFEGCRALAAFGLAVAVTASARGDDIQPPPPNPAQPVDYIDWVNEAFGKDVRRNAAKSYQAAYRKIKPFDGDWGSTITEPWTHNPEVGAWLKENKTALKLFARATDKKDCYIPLKDPKPVGVRRFDRLMINAEVPHLNEHRTAVMGLLAQGYQAHAKGKEGLLIENALTCLRSASHLECSADSASRLAAEACASMACRTLRDALQRSMDQGQTATDLLPRLQAIIAPERSLERAVLYERVAIWDLCQRVYIDDGGGGLKVHPHAKDHVSVLSKPGDSDRLAAIGYEASLRDANHYFDRCLELIREPFPLARETALEVEALVEQSTNPIVGGASSMWHVREIDIAGEADRSGTLLLTFILAHRQKHGDYPNRLDELDAPNLGQLRVDPFTRRDFVYKRTGKDFILYSLYLNLRDDGGNHDREADKVFWPVAPGIW
ncbi:MAG: hypothetical protein JSV78_04700 [Phycisphaerales bacterium]|nr:MAG: hypothetical protein JSV78_04700 [Phycisphaerales bacterium]